MLGLMKSDVQTVRPPSSRISHLVSHEASAHSCIPIAMLSRADVSSLGLDARALFVFGFVNDRTPVVDLLTMSGMPMADAADALAALCDVGAVALVDNAR